MALSDPKNTLAYHRSRPLCVGKNNSDVPVITLTSAMYAYMQSPLHSKGKPEAEALWFYGLNHVTAEIAQRRAPLEPLTEWEQKLFTAYHAICGKNAVRSFYYLVWICTREARHCYHIHGHVPKLNAIGVGLGDFYSSINGGETGISAKLLASPPPCTVGQYMDSLVYLFDKGSWGGSFGGEKWRVIADVARKFANGEFSAEMMLDTLFTLQHNSCSIFNKGEFYLNFSPTLLPRILDVQRSGQIPHAILGDPAIKACSSALLLSLMIEAKAVYPDVVKDVVDWHMVEALGALDTYPQEKAQQILTPAQKAELKAKVAAAEAAEVAAMEAEKKKKAEFKKTHLQIMPEVWVPKVKMQRVA